MNDTLLLINFDFFSFIFMFLDCDMILKIYFKKIYDFDVFLNKKYFEMQHLPYSQIGPTSVFVFAFKERF
jgi:hypothetical protein